MLIKGYHTDNVVFDYLYFMDYILKKQQKIRISGSIASYPNMAENQALVKMVTMERNMFVHAVIISPEDTVSTNHWPIPMYYAVWIYNQIPDMKSVLSAIIYGQGQGLIQCHKP